MSHPYQFRLEIIKALKTNHTLNDLLRVAKIPRSTFYYQ